MSALTRDAAPPLSVAMPVYNAEAYVDEAIRSVLGQSWGDFEFVVYDDASTDRTGAIIRACRLQYSSAAPDRPRYPSEA